MRVDPPPELVLAFAAAVADAQPGEDLVALGGDLSPATVVAAYRAGVFPMGVGPGGSEPIGWWSPDPRGVLPLERLRRTRSLRAACRRLEVRVDTAFDAVITACAAPDRPGAWITDAVRGAYRRLHRLGLAHSVESWDGDRLVGGLYGISVGGLFAGESMFHHERDASKVALVGLVDLLLADARPGRLLDVQWVTPHLATLGAVALDRSEYVARLDVALTCPGPAWPARPGSCPGT